MEQGQIKTGTAIAWLRIRWILEKKNSHWSQFFFNTAIPHDTVQHEIYHDPSHTPVTS